MELENNPLDPSLNPASQRGRGAALFYGTILRHLESQTLVKIGNRVQNLPLLPSLLEGTEVRVRLSPAGEWTVEAVSRPAGSGFAAQAVSLADPKIVDGPGSYETAGRELRKGTVYFGRVLRELPPPPSVAASGGPKSLQKYLVEVAGKVFEGFADRGLQAGELFNFKLFSAENIPRIHVLDFTASVPTELKAIFSENSVPYQPAYAAAREALSAWSTESYFPPAVVDFGRWLLDTGAIRSDGSLAVPPAPGQIQSHLQQLLYLYLCAEAQSSVDSGAVRSWLRARQDPEWVLKWLGGVRPAPESSEDKQSPRPALLKFNQPLEFSEDHPLRRFLPLRGPATPEHLWERLAELEKSGKADPEVRQHKQVLDAFRAEFILQQEGFSEGIGLGFAWRGDRWEKIRWRRFRPGGAGEDGEGLAFYLETRGKNLGAVRVDVSLNKKGASLFFRDESGRAGNVLEEELGLLQKSLGHLDFNIVEWKYGRLEPVNVKQSPRYRSRGPDTPGLDVFI